jgi:squalene-associated FAD-dependent desaturase
VSADREIGRGLEDMGALYRRLIQPVLVAALNTEPAEASAALASAVLRETIALGGQACRPLVARSGLSDVLIVPALRHLKERGVELRLEHELRAIRFSGAGVSALDFGADRIELGRDDAVILAVPPHAASALVPDLTVPQQYRAIVNGHFRVPPPPNAPPITGVVNGTVEWLFAFPDRLSITISNADRLVDAPRAELAQTIWQDVCRTLGIAGEMPPWQIVRERRATFAATPAENAKRPGARTAWGNLVLAGDWTATGLPATLESAARSGQRAAGLVGGSGG